MRLYRYFHSHADVTLNENQLLLSRVSGFNDPFEFSHCFSGEYTVDQAEQDLAPMSDEDVETYLSNISKCQNFNSLSVGSPRRLLANFFISNGGTPPIDIFYLHKIADDFFRVCCFSKTDVTSDSEILLWSHYANSHRGVRIEFELDEKTIPLSEVIYSRKRCAIEFSKANEGDHTNEILRRAIHTKSEAWNYEREVRLILKKNLLSTTSGPDSDMHFLPFDKSWVKSVDFGINCDDGTIERVSTILRSEYPGVTIRRVFHHPEDYAIDYRAI